MGGDGDAGTALCHHHQTYCIYGRPKRPAERTTKTEGKDRRSVVLATLIDSSKEQRTRHAVVVVFSIATRIYALSNTRPRNCAKSAAFEHSRSLCLTCSSSSY